MECVTSRQLAMDFANALYLFSAAFIFLFIALIFFNAVYLWFSVRCFEPFSDDVGGHDVY